MLQTPQEINPQCWQPILDNQRWCNQLTGHNRPSPHIFPDVLHMLPEIGWASGLPDMESQLLRAAGMPLNCCLPCNSCHMEGTRCLVPDVDLDVAGLPCVDYSAAGKRKGSRGRSSPVFVAWAKRHKTLGTKLLILENTSAPWPQGS